jgi:hypothetical protein
MMNRVEIVLIMVAALVTIFTTRSWKKLKKWQRVSCVLAALTALVLAFNQWQKLTDEELVKRAEAEIGEIHDRRTIKVPKVVVGRSEVSFQLLEKDGLVFGSSGSPLLKTFIKNGKLCVYVIIRDSLMKPLAVINENEWSLMKGATDIFEYNNDDHAFELVVKGERNVYFQIELKSGIAYITGLLYEKPRLGLFFYDDGRGGGVITFKRPLDPYEFPRIESMFRYPRETHLGERINP